VAGIEKSSVNGSLNNRDRPQLSDYYLVRFPNASGAAVSSAVTSDLAQTWLISHFGGKRVVGDFEPLRGPGHAKS